MIPPQETPKQAIAGSCRPAAAARSGESVVPRVLDYSLSFRKQIGPLSRAGYRVVVPDQRGYNLSGKGGPYDLDTVAADAVHLLDALGAPAAHVVGHDWGGLVAWRLAERHPDRLRTLTILNVPHLTVTARSMVHGNLRQIARSSYIYVFQLPWLPEWLLRRNNFALMRRGLERTSLPGTFTPDDLDRLARAWAEPGALRAMLGWYRALPRSLRQASRPPRRLSMPGLILWGERDVALDVRLAEESAALLDSGRLVRFPDATHWLHEEFPDVVNALLVGHWGS